DLEARLRSDASAWATAESSSASVCDRSPKGELASKKSRGWQMTISAGLVAAASLVLFASLRPQDTTEPKKTTVTFQPAVEDVQQATNELQALTSVFADSLDGIDASFNGLSSATRNPFEVADRRLLRDAIKQPLESFSRGYGKAIAFIAKHQVRTEND
ncbi:MAG: hypothetical protein AAF497_27180, partial [Planctomycetota bacterium]